MTWRGWQITTNISPKRGNFAVGLWRKDITESSGRRLAAGIGVDLGRKLVRAYGDLGERSFHVMRQLGAR